MRNEKLGIRNEKLLVVRVCYPVSPESPEQALLAVIPIIPTPPQKKSKKDLVYFINLFIFAVPKEL